MNNSRTLKMIQEELNLTQKDFAVFVGVSTRTMNGWISDGQPNTCPEYVIGLIERAAEADLRAIRNGDPTTQMRRWAVIDATDREEFLTVCGNKADALREAEIQWNHLTEAEREKRETFAVCLIAVQLTYEGSSRFTWYEDENYNIDSNIYAIAKDYLS